jgi:hypothetical protein
MMNNNLTPEEIQLNISAALDSVDLINKTTSSQEDIELSISHLKIMMSKDWFENALTEEQKTNIIKIIKI